MRKEDIKNLEIPIETKDYFESEKAFKAAIGVATPNLDKLAACVNSDLEIQSQGINWWMSLPAAERILISDYFYQALTAIDTNLVEAKLHLMEWQDAYDRQNRRISDSVQMDGRGELYVKLPPHKAPYDHIPHRLQDLHVAGFLRAIGSTLDCLAATIVVVLGLPMKVRKTDISSVMKRLAKVDSSAGPNSKIHKDFYDYFEATKRAAGSQDWLEWADQYRNVFVHRGRRIVFQELSPKEPAVLDSFGRRILRSNEISHLPKYPDRSEIEAFIKAKDIVLNEDAELTLTGILNSTRNLVEPVCAELESIWTMRRKSPDLIAQPAIQWGDTPKLCNFNGYSSSSEPLDMDVLISNPKVRFRMKMGAVVDSQRSFWRGSRFEE